MDKAFIILGIGFALAIAAVLLWLMAIAPVPCC